MTHTGAGHASHPRVRGRSGSLLHRSVAAMGGTARISVVSGSSEALDAAEALTRHLEHLWSRFRADSDITRLNTHPGHPVAVDPLTVTLIESMRAGWRETDGEFDPSVLPAVVSVGYDRSLVDGSALPALPPTVSTRRSLDAMRVEGNEVTLPVGMALDPGGIGKGFAADLVVALLLDRGVGGAMVEIGGDIRVAGEAPDGVAWRIARENPFDPTRTTGMVRVVDGGVATSSQRKKRFPTGASGTTNHHLIDPRTARSADTGIQTATVIAATGARAEILTKPAFLRDPDEYLAWLPTVGAVGLLTHADGSTTTSTGWSTYA